MKAAKFATKGAPISFPRLLRSHGLEKMKREKTNNMHRVHFQASIPTQPWPPIKNNPFKTATVSVNFYRGQVYLLVAKKLLKPTNGVFLPHMVQPQIMLSHAKGEAMPAGNFYIVFGNVGIISAT